MKELFLALVVLFLVCITCLCRAADTLVICNEGTVSCEIVVPDEAGPVAAFAGKELKELLSQSLSADIPVVKIPSGKKTAIILGNNQFLKNAGIDINKLPRDGFIMKSSGNNIFIAGIDSMKNDPERGLKYGVQLYEQATLFGIYDFLERFVGVRFYFPGKIGTVIPKHKTLKLQAVDIFEKPDFTVRNLSIYSGMIPDSDEVWPESARKNFPFEFGSASTPFKSLCYYRLRLQTNLIPSTHGLARLDYISRFGKTHPEYFALKENGERYILPFGFLCFSSDIKDEIYKDAEAFLTGKPASSRNIKRWDPSGCQPGYFSLMPQDGFYCCNCPECQKYFSKGPKATSEFIWNFVCDIAEKLKKNNIPGYITMSAYDSYIIVPDREIPPYIIVLLCETGPWALHNPKVSEKESEEIKTWYNKQKRKIWLWNYINKYSKRIILDVPAVTPKCIGEYYKLQSPYIFGAFLQSETDRFIYNYLNYYVFAKVAWNNTVDVDKLLKEHYQKMFGAAAGVMEKIYEHFEGNWLNIIGKPIETPFGPQHVPVSDYEIWEKIYSKSEIDFLDRQFFEAERLTASSAEDNERVRFMRENMFNPLKEARELYLKNKNEISDWNFYSPAAESQIKIDGSLDEKNWNDAEKVFLRPCLKDYGKTDTLKTIVRSLHDKDNLYLAFECEEPEIEHMVSAERKYDDKDIWTDSSVEIFLNPSGDRKKYYQILVNASGSLSDLAGEMTGASHTDDWTWNSEASVAVKKNKNSWTVEIAIPLKNLPGFNPAGTPVNFNRNRVLRKKDGDYAKLFTWSPFLRNSFHEIENFGSVRFNKKNDGNIIQNGDFTAEVNGRAIGQWTAPQKENMKNGESWTVVSDEFVKGGKSLMLKCPEKGGIIITQYLHDLQPDKEYLLTFFVKTQDIVPLEGNCSGVCVNIYQEKNRWFPDSFYTGSMPWTKFGFKFKTGRSKGDEKDLQYIRLCIMKAKGTAWFDDVKIVPVEK